MAANPPTSLAYYFTKVQDGVLDETLLYHPPAILRAYSPLYHNHCEKSGMIWSGKKRW